MGFFFWRRKREKEELQRIVEHIKQEFKKAADWITHLHKRDGKHEEEIESIKERIDELDEEIKEIKKVLSFFGPYVFKQKHMFIENVFKQTDVENIQTVVQTRKKTQDFISNLTTMERAIIWVLLNTELKLSYDDIAAILGKNRATIRGQVNSIKQKSEGLIREIIEKTGKKRIYIPEEIKDRLIKTLKISKTEREKKKKIRKFV